MSNRSNRHLMGIFGLDQKGIPAFARPWRRTNVPITTQFMGMRRMRGRSANISSTPLYEWTFSRTSAVSEQDPAGRWSTLGSNVEAYWQRQGLNRLMWQIERQTTNQLLNSAAPVSQTTGTVAVASYVLWMEGTGSVTIAANTGVATGLGTATAAAPILITVTTAGTFNITVTGSVTRFQLEGTNFTQPIPTSFVVTSGTTASRTVGTFRWLPTQLGSGLLGSAGTLVGQYFSPATWPLWGVTATSINISDGTNANRISLNVAANGSVKRMLVTNGGTVTATLNSTVTPQANTVYRFAMAWDASGVAFAHTGMSNVVTSAQLPGATLNQINIGANPDGTNPWFAPLGLISRFPIRLSNQLLLDAVARV